MNKRPDTDALVEMLLSKQYDPDDERHAALSKRLAMVLSAYVDAGLFQAAPGKKETERQIKPLLTALDNVRAALNKLDPVIYRKINRQLYEGDIPILDAVSGHAGGGRTDAPQNIADVLYDLAGTLTSRITDIPVANGKHGPKSDRRSMFLAQELAYIFRYATGNDASDVGFLEFVEWVIKEAAIDLSAEHISKLALETVTTPITMISG